MPRPEKVAVVDEIRTKLAESGATLLTEYRGLTVHEIAALRGTLRASDTEYKVFKNTLARRAVADSGLDGVASMFEGPVAIAFVRGDAAAAAKALRDYGRTHPALVLKGGILGTRVISPVEFDALADLPSRDALLAQIAGVFQAPLTKAAGLFQAFPRNFAYGLKALIDQRIAGGEAAPAAETAPEIEAEVAAEPETGAEADDAPAAPVVTDAAPEPEAAAEASEPAAEATEPPAADPATEPPAESTDTESE